MMWNTLNPLGCVFVFICVCVCVCVSKFQLDPVSQMSFNMVSFGFIITIIITFDFFFKQTHIDIWSNLFKEFQSEFKGIFKASLSGFKWNQVVGFHYFSVFIQVNSFLRENLFQKFVAVDSVTVQLDSNDFPKKIEWKWYIFKWIHNYFWNDLKSFKFISPIQIAGILFYFKIVFKIISTIQSNWNSSHAMNSLIITKKLTLLKKGLWNDLKRLEAISFQSVKIFFHRQSHLGTVSRGRLVEKQTNLIT